MPALSGQVEGQTPELSVTSGKSFPLGPDFPVFKIQKSEQVDSLSLEPFLLREPVAPNLKFNFNLR
jgi:hypothetical protein